jgi:hypothetical protein
MNYKDYDNEISLFIYFDDFRGFRQDKFTILSLDLKILLVFYTDFKVKFRNDGNLISIMNF